MPVNELKDVKLPATAISGDEIEIKATYEASDDNLQIAIRAAPEGDFTVSPPSLPAPANEREATARVTFTRAPGAIGTCFVTFTLKDSWKLKSIDVKAKDR